MDSLKNIVKKIDRGMISKTQIIDKIQKYPYISFDIFDTILKRNVKNPTDVFELMEMELGKEYLGFKDKRMFAEKKARESTKKEEISLHDIYTQYLMISEIPINRLMRLEMETEASILTLNQDIFEIYQKCLEMKKGIFFISDMYLPQKFLENVLNHLGVHNYKNIYVSCEYKKTKRTGTLFRLFLEEEKIRANEIVHIGDSIFADYKIPRSLGIRAIHIPQFTRRSSYEITNRSNSIHLDYLNFFLNNHVPDLPNTYYKFGFEKFGMFLWGYVKWLYDSVKKQGIHRVYFLSRDGFIMKKAFDIINPDPSIKTYYLEVSRRSLRIPILWMDPSFSTLLDMLTPSRNVSLLSIFDGIGLDITKYEDMIMDCGLSKESIFDRKNIFENQELLSLYNKIIPKVIEKSKNEYETLKKYMRQNHLSGKFAIVDIGWSGGMQRYLEQTLKSLQISYQISGYYIGIASYHKRNIDIIPTLDLNGYLFDLNRDPNDKDLRSCFVGLFETLFLEQDGSVKNYSEDTKSGIVTADRYPYEYIQNGKFAKEFLKVKEIQKGALDFIECVSHDRYLNKFEYTPKELFKGIEETGTNPKISDLELFADFRFYDEGKISKLADPKNVFYYLIRPSELKKDFYMSRWKIGFLKKLFKIPVKYKYIYDFLKYFYHE